MMESAWSLERPLQTEEPAIRRIGAADVWEALRRGWDDFLANPTQLVFLAILYPIIGLIAARAMSGREVLPLLWPMASGFALVGPVAAIGLYELSRRRERGLPVSWHHALDVRHSPAFGSILGLGLMLVVVFLLWLACAWAIYAATLGDARPTTPMALLERVFSTRDGIRLLVWGNAAGLLFAAGVLAMTVVSFPLLLDRAAEGRPVEAGAAIRASFRAVAANPGPMALWGLIVAALLAVGSLPFFVGLAVVLPVLGHGTWHLYRKVVAR